MAGATRSRSGKHRAKPDPIARAVGARIRQLRKERGFVFDAFVEETGLGRGYISELERGLVVPSLHTLARVAKALELTVADVVLGTSPREQLFEAARDLPAKVVAELLAHVRSLPRPPGA